jgi:hypothetical protein
MKIMLIRKLFGLFYLGVTFLLVFYSGWSFSFQEEEVSAVLPTVSDSKQHNPETVILRYTEKLNLLRDSEGSASLQIYNDGYVAVYYPAYMQRAGNYGLYLDQKTMERLWAMLTSKDILEFSKKSVRQRMITEKQAQEKQLSNVADAATTLIEIYPNRYQNQGYGDGTPGAVKKISWHGLKWDARDYPDIQIIQYLLMVLQELHTVMERADLTMIDNVTK